jgi:hypothetical protein
MSPTSYQAAPPRVRYRNLALPTKESSRSTRDQRGTRLDEGGMSAGSQTAARDEGYAGTGGGDDTPGTTRDGPTGPDDCGTGNSTVVIMPRDTTARSSCAMLDTS